LLASLPCVALCDEREEAVQGAGTVALVLVLGTAASDASDANRVRSRWGVWFAVVRRLTARRWIDGA